MIPLLLGEIVEMVRGRACGEPPTVSVCGVSTDSRTIRPGELFFALRGPRFDGHEFVAEALGRGAAGAVIAESSAASLLGRLRKMHNASGSSLSRGCCQPGMLIAVDDPLAALARLAAACRQRLSATVIAVVGSNGKTTTKAMLHHILAQRFRGRASPRSFNNQVGVPLTLLASEPSDEYLVVEIGTNRPGEIAALADLVRPDLAVLTSLSEEHLEGLGDLEGVAREEFELFPANAGRRVLCHKRGLAPGTPETASGRYPRGHLRVESGRGCSADGGPLRLAVAAFYAERAVSLPTANGRDT
jgi:UDP-N-acetylmuramoyl-tripeptide--D-alanyl-D-alanine ligase